MAVPLTLVRQDVCSGGTDKTFTLTYFLTAGGRWGTTDDFTTSFRYGMVADFSHSDSRAKNNLTEPIPFQVEYMAVEFDVEPLRPPGPSLSNYEDIRPVIPS